MSFGPEERFDNLFWLQASADVMKRGADLAAIVADFVA
jgi:hypothetical protein